jgi:hypothetical protein
MTATVVIQEVTGTSVTYQTVTNRVRLMTIDAATNQTTAQTSNPVIIPKDATSGYGGLAYNYSFWKSVCLDITGSGFIITNINHYSNGDITGTWTFGANGALNRGSITGSKGSVAQGCPTANYAQATGVIGTSGDPIDDAGAGHPYYKSSGGVADVNDDLSGSLALIDDTAYSTASKSNMIVLQVKVQNTGTQGTQTAKTLTWQYDES